MPELRTTGLFIAVPLVLSGTLGWAQDAGLEAARKEGKVVWYTVGLGIVYPQDDVPLIVTPTGITSFAPHPNAARRFIDFLFTREIQQCLVEREGPLRPPPRGDLSVGQAAAIRSEAPGHRSRGARAPDRRNQEALRGALRCVAPFGA